jgi:hypothetical protein
MNPKTRNPKPRHGDPFDGSAPARLIRMNLLKPNGEPNPTTLPAYAGIFTADFFDAIADFYDDDRILRSVCDILADYHAHREYERTLVFLCIQHDAILKPLPDPLWWMAGVPMLVNAFLDCFIERLSELIREVET